MSKLLSNDNAKFGTEDAMSKSLVTADAVTNSLLLGWWCFLESGLAAPCRFLWPAGFSIALTSCWSSLTFL
jgi:hypothetical protein